jgi:hypothetical protein
MPWELDEPAVIEQVLRLDMKGVRTYRHEVLNKVLYDIKL